MKKKWTSMIAAGMMAAGVIAGAGTASASAPVTDQSEESVSISSTGSLINELSNAGLSNSVPTISVTAKQGSAVNISNEKTVIDNIIKTGQSLIGNARYGHTYNAPYTMDCSGFTYYIFKQNGIDLKTRDDDKQVSYGKYVPKSQLKAGDLVFYNANKPSKDVTHVGVYIGDGKVLHMANSMSNVTISKLSGSWHTDNYLTARRIVQ